MKHLNSDKTLLLGLVLIIFSSGLFVLEPEIQKDTSNLFTFVFLIHYSLPIVYSMVIWKKFGRSFLVVFSQDVFSSQLLLLILFNISAFALNREMVVFFESADWVQVLIVCESLLLMIIALLKKVPAWTRALVFCLLPSCFLFHAHQVVMVLPLAVFGLFGAFFIGIGLLLFVPGFYIAAIVAILKRLKLKSTDTVPLALGIIAPIVAMAYSLIAWHAIDRTIEAAYDDMDRPFEATDLPDWIEVAKTLPDDHTTEAYLKSDLVFQHYKRFDFGATRFGRRRYEEQKIHDPLVSLCMGFSFEAALDETSRIKTLKFLHNKRHQTADRFWSGNHLFTERVVSNVQLLPKERLSYTEMILSIANKAPKSRWRRQEEAIYTFQLPEGGVITSLSLWIEGEEQKAILTTKSKAQTAYNTIVGRERRDPSVIYWMEGNKARIRVFPCTPAANRKFKVGVTAPLLLQQNTLNYQPITFEGPSAADATSSVHIVGAGKNVSSSLSLRKETDLLTWQGKYLPVWHLEIPATNLEQVAFTYNNQSYRTTASKRALSEQQFETIYLDLNSHWTAEERKSIATLFSNKKMVVLEGPHDFTSASARFPHFTLFPYDHLSNRESALVITKGGMHTPNLQDLTGYEFKDRIYAHFHQSNAPTLVLDIGSYPSDYNKSLKELGAISHHLVSLDQLSRFVQTGQFPDPTPNSQVVEIAGNGISIEKTADADAPKGSDHLMRLFYYQSVMDEIGRQYFSGDPQSYIEEHLAEATSAANIVTPVSSLIVLETQEDYDRFDIEKNEDGLGNASLQNHGAVPEPHEWALIIAGVCFGLFIFIKSRLL